MGRYQAKHSESARRRDIQLIHVAKTQLGLDDATYRAMLHSVAGVTSSVQLDVAGRVKVIKHLKACGFKVATGKRAGQTHRPLAAGKQAIEAKIGALLKALDADWPYAYAVARRIYPDVDRFEFLDASQLGKVASALERTLKYRKG